MSRQSREQLDRSRRYFGGEKELCQLLNTLQFVCILASSMRRHRSALLFADGRRITSPYYLRRYDLRSTAILLDPATVACGAYRLAILNFLGVSGLTLSEPPHWGAGLRAVLPGCYPVCPRLIFEAHGQQLMPVIGIIETQFWIGQSVRLASCQAWARNSPLPQFKFPQKSPKEEVNMI